MKILDIEQNSEEWEEFRKGKISGSKLGDVVPRRDSGLRKDGFYQLVADRIAIQPDGEPPMDRGHRLEIEAIATFRKITGLSIVENSCVWVSDTDENMMVSPDAYVKPGKNGKITHAVEIKCLASHKHIRAIIEGKYPDEYREQILQYFIVNDDLETLYFVMYDDRVPSHPIEIFQILRSEVEEKLELYKEKQLEVLKEINEIVERLAF